MKNPIWVIKYKRTETQEYLCHFDVGWADGSRMTKEKALESWEFEKVLKGLEDATIVEMYEQEKGQ